MVNQANQASQLTKLATLAGSIQEKADKRAQDQPSPVAPAPTPTIIIQPPKGSP